MLRETPEFVPEVCVQSGNLAIEYETSEKPHGQGQKWPSGISKSKSYWYVLEYAHERRIVIPTPEVKDIARAAIRSGKHVWGGDNARFHNALIPFEWFAHGVPAHVLDALERKAA